MTVISATPVYSKTPTRAKYGKTNIRPLSNRKGVYIIRENDKVVYIGNSNNCIYRTIMRHFYKWNDRAQKDE